MLPLYGLALVSTDKSDPAGTVALAIMVAQGVMIIAALIAMRLASGTATDFGSP
jgi:hypothetical protein